MLEQFQWNTKPRVVTYQNPCEITNNPELKSLVEKYPHLCASDTLMMGMLNKYGRNSFTYITTINRIIDFLYDFKVNSKEKDLQMFMDISDCIYSLKDEDSKTVKAMMNNRGQLVESFKMLTLLQYKCISVPNNKEIKLFFEKIYNPLANSYIDEYSALIKNSSRKDLLTALNKCFCNEAYHTLKIHDNSNLCIEKFREDIKDNKSYLAAIYKELLDNISEFDLSTVIIHGVARFTPEIMMLIKTLDNMGINIIFMINYVSNYNNLYSFWEKTYKWIGVPFEYVEALDISSGNIVGQNIALVSEGIRTNQQSNASIVKYSTLTDFTDGPIRKEFLKAEKKAKENDSDNVLGYMKTQYYAVVADEPNDILKHYFPDQFLEKPFLSYPVGQFIKAILGMWDNDLWKMKIDFSLLKECASVKIGHNNNCMVKILDSIKLFCKGVQYVDEIEERLDVLVENIKSIDNNQKRILSYLSFYALDIEDLVDVKKYIQELNRINVKIFGGEKNQIIDFQKKFLEIINIVNDGKANNNVLSKKEDELISSILNLLKDSNNDISGGIRDLKEALYYFLSVKKRNSGADWIVRGFDQIDGAPLMKKTTGTTYEFALMSMKNMTKPQSNILPWPLDDSIFINSGYCLYYDQIRNIIELRNAYLRFYFFYGAFFSKGAKIQFSYVENEGEEKQRPYYLLDLLEMPYKNNNSKNDKEYYIVNDESDITSKDVNISKRELNIFSVCRYKYFLTSILKDNMKYISEYHINYYIKNETTYYLEDKCKNNICNISKEIKSTNDLLHRLFPYIDESLMSDIDRYVKENFQTGIRGEEYLQKKRDFLLAAWKDREKDIDYMKFNKGIKDVREYMQSSELFPRGNSKPYNKICEECNYNELCLNYYQDNEVKE